jgi:hypothetical protein
MTIKVASYLMGIPPGNTNPEKPAIIVNFIEGVWKTGDEGTIVTDYTPVDADVAVIQGFVHENSKNALHLKLRKAVYEKQLADNKRTIIVDSNLFLSYDPKNTKKYLRYSYDGIFPSTGEYCNANPDPSRWEKIKQELGIELKPWQKNSNGHILICCQRDGGWSMDGESLMPWLVKTIAQIKKVSSKKIVVRFHPGDKGILNHKRTLARYRFKDIFISSSDNLIEDFKNCYAVVNYNSSPAVVAAIEGIPVFVLDPKRSQAAEVAHHKLDEIEKIRDFDRTQWIQKMAQMHWTLDELKDGTAWKHLRQWAIKQ